MPAEETRRQKAELREHLRAARRAIAAGDRAAAGHALAGRVLALPELASAGTVLVYGAAPEEIDPREIEDALRARGVRIGYPRVAGRGELTLHEVRRAEDLTRGSFGLTEPRADAPLLDPASVDVVIVPGVAFDAQGGRLGFGGGYYDALLAGELGHAAKVGVAFDAQIVERVPREPHDAVVDVVVTPTRTMRA